jgi:glucose-1-phosphate thymidylyltransferase
VVLAAGYATRLRPLTDQVAKPLLPLAGRPMLDYLYDRIAEVGEVDELHVVTNARFAADFRVWAESGERPLPVVVHDDGTTSNDDRLGAVGDMAFAIERGGIEGQDLLVLAGDNLLGYSLEDLVSFWRERRGGAALAVHRVPDPELIKQYGVVELDADDRVVSLEEKPSQPRSDLAATAAYVYPAAHAASIPRYLEEGNSPDAPGNFLVWLYRREPVYGYRFTGDWMDIGDPEQLLDADNRMREQAGMPPRAKYSLEK